MSVLSDFQNNMKGGVIGTRDNPLVNPVTQASAAGLFVPTYPITVVSGTEAYTGITIPFADFAGSIIVIPLGAITWTTATNIAVAGTGVANKAIVFTYVPHTGKWYPSYV